MSDLRASAVTLLEQHLILTPENSKTNIFFEFDVDDDYSKLYIDAAYFPKHCYEYDKSRAILEDCLVRYNVDVSDLEPGEYEGALPLTNMVCFSIECNDQYRGCAHRGANTSHFEISEEGATYGLYKGKIERGKWRACCNVNSIVSEKVHYHLLITGVKKEGK